MATPDAPQPTVAASDLDRTVNVVQTPTSPSSAFTLSRFEFETGTKGNEGTKILMVEWDAAAAKGAGQKDGDEQQKMKIEKANVDEWEVKWEGKEALLVLPICDMDAPKTTCRIYFLLPPKAPIPTLVTISPKESSSSSSSSTKSGSAAAAAAEADLNTKPLPAIFPEGLQVHEERGTRGVLHTIWAKKRLEQLSAEIAAEMKSNGEGVGLEMALQEKQWIVDHFGLQIDTSSAGAIPLPPQSPASATTSPASPRSPIGGRLGEKLKGLKLATSPAELAAAKEGMYRTWPCPPSHLPTPQLSLLAVYVTSWWWWWRHSGLIFLCPLAAAKSSTTALRQVVAVAPDTMATGGAGPGAGGMASLSAVIQQGGGGASGIPGAEKDGTEEDLFALPMSPRSPEMAMSPFSLLKS